MANPHDNIYRLYQNGLQHFSLPDFETFKKDMQDEEKRRRFYNNMQEAYSLPDFNTFSTDIGAVSSAPAQTQTTTTQTTSTPSTVDNTAQQAAVTNTTAQTATAQTGWKPSPVQQMYFQDQMNAANERLRKIGEEGQRRLAGIQKGNRPGAFMGEIEYNPQTGRRERVFYTETGERVGTQMQQSHINTEHRTWWENNTEEGKRSKELRLEREDDARQQVFDSSVASLWSRHDPTDGENAAEQAWKSALGRQSADANRIADEIYRDRGDAMTNAALLGGPENKYMNASLNRHRQQVAHLTNFDLDRLMNDAWNNLGEEGQKALIEDCYQMLKKRNPGADDILIYNQAKEFARKQSDLRLYNLAVEKNRPQDELQYFLKTIGDMNLMNNITKGLAVSQAKTTGDMAASEQATEEYRQDGHKILGVAGTVVGFAVDPVTWVSGGVGSAAGHGAMWVGGRWIAGRGATAAMTNAMTRQFATSMTGRIVGGVVGGAANFGTYEGIKEIENQFAHGGHITGREDTGQFINEGYSASAVGGQMLHGMGMGAAIGWLGPVTGNVSDKLVRGGGKLFGKEMSGISNAYGKMATRAGLYTGSTVLEGTIFSVPEWIEGNRDAFDVWTDNMAMMAGFKATHMLKSAGGVLGDLQASFESPTNGHKNRLDFESRLRMRMDTPTDGGLKLSKDETGELERLGYGDLRELVESAGDPSKKDLITSNAPEMVSRLTEMVKDTRVSEAARAKMYYYATGRKLNESPIMRGEMVEDGNGGYIVESQGANGVITSRTFESRKAADLELERIKRQAELNQIEIGERYKQGEDLQTRLQDACRKVADENGWRAIDVYKLCEEARSNYLKGGNKEFVEAQEEILRKVTEAMGEFDETGATDAIREAINEKYGVDIDGAIRKDANRRTLAEQTAIDEYIEELFPKKEPNAFEDVEAEDITDQKQITDDPDQPDQPTDPRFDENGEERPIGRAVMKHKDREVEVLSGRVVMHPDGTMVDNAASDKTIVIRDIETGEVEMVSPEAILTYEDYIYGGEEPMMDGADHAAPEAEAGVEPSKYTSGEITIRNSDGTESRGWLTGYTDEEGRHEYYVEGNIQQLHYATDSELDNILSDFKPDAPAEQPAEGAASPEETPASPEEEQPLTDVEAYDNGFQHGLQALTDGRPMTDAELGKEIDNLRSGDPALLTDFGRGWLAGLEHEQQRRAQEAQPIQPQGEQGERPMPEQPQPTTPEEAVIEGGINGTAEGLRDAFAEERERIGNEWLDNPGVQEALKVYTEGTTTVEELVEKAKADSTDESTRKRLDTLLEFDSTRQKLQALLPQADNNGAKNIQENGNNTGENIPTEAEQPQSALAQVPLNEKGEPDFAKADAETGWDGLVEAAGDEKGASEVALAQIEQARKELEDLKKKQPTLKAPKLKGSAMAMIEARKAAEKKYSEDIAEHNAKIAAAQENLDAWTRIRAVNVSRQAEARRIEDERRRERDEQLRAESEARFQEEMRIKAEKETEQAERGPYKAHPSIKEKWDNATKLYGKPTFITLADGRTIPGRFVYHDAFATTPSHDPFNNWQISEGSPLTPEGVSVNPRAYDKDIDAQRTQEAIAADFDTRGIRDDKVVSEGNTVSGNGADTSRKIAAKNGTDGKYLDGLFRKAEEEGIDIESLKQIEHPTRSFEPDEPLPFTPETYDIFNADDKKGQSRDESAVRMGMIVPEETLSDIVRTVGQYDTLTDFYKKDTDTNHVLGALAAAGVISQKDMPKYRNGTELSGAGQDLIEQVLLGKMFDGNPDAVRMLKDYKGMRRMIISAMAEISANRVLGKPEYRLTDELAEAIGLVFRAKSSMPDTFTDGVPVSWFGSQSGLFDDVFGDRRVTNPASLILSDILNSGKEAQLRKYLAIYNAQAADGVSGTANMFDEPDENGVIQPRTKEKILNEINEIFKTATPKELQEKILKAYENRKQRAADGTIQQGESADAETANGVERVETVAVGGNSSGDGQVNVGRGGNGHDTPRQDIVEREQIAESDTETDDNGLPLLLSSDGTTTFGEIGKNEGIEAGPIKLSLGFDSVDANGKHHGYGHTHIDAQRGATIREAGFATVGEFVEFVSKNRTTIKEGNVRKNGKKTYIIEVIDTRLNDEEHTNMLYIELASNGDYWLVNSGGIMRPDYTKGKKEIKKEESSDSLPAVETSPATADEEVQKRGGSSMSGNSPSEDSERKVTNSASDKQVVEGESSEKEPTEAQKLAGNYKKEHLTIDSHKISIENKKGSVRSGKDADGKEWHTEMHNDYGYIRGTEGVDGDHIDVYLSDTPEHGDVYVIDQYNPDGTFDEHKVMYGFPDEKSAKDAYLSNYEHGWEDTRRLDITHVSKDDFKAWVQSSKRKTKPFAEYKSVKPVAPEKAPEAIEGKGYKVVSKPYTNKQGKTLDTQLVTFDRDFSKEEMSALRAKAKTLKGWYDRESGGWMLRSVEDAKAFAEEVMGKSEDAIADEAPLSMTDMANTSDKPANAPAIKPASKEAPKPIESVNGYKVGDKVLYDRNGTGKWEEQTIIDFDASGKPVFDSFGQGWITELGDWERIKPMEQAPTARKKQESPIKKVDVEGMMGALQSKGETKLSDHAEPVEQPKPKKRRWISDEDASEFDKLRNDLRSHLGADDNVAHEESVGYGAPQPKPMDAEVIRMGTRMTYLMMKGGLRKFSDYAEAMVDEVGDAIRPHLKSLYAAAQNMEEVMQLGWDEEMDDRKAVKAFDVYNFDKPGAKDIVATAQHIVDENQSQKETEKIIQDLKEKRNEQRKADADKTSADTEAVVNQAETTASKIENQLEDAKTEQDAQDLHQAIDAEIEKVNEQLALLGYYVAQPEEGDFNEAYGYMRNAERQAAADAHKLGVQLAEDLGIEVTKNGVKKIRKNRVTTGFGSSIVSSNVAPAGGEVRITLPLNENRELAITIHLEPSHERGVESRRGGGAWQGDNLEVTGIYYRVEGGERSRNCWLEPSVTYDEMLAGIRREIRHFLPADEVKPGTPLTPQPGEDYVDVAKRVSKERKKEREKEPAMKPEQPMGNLFGDLFADELPTQTETPAQTPAPKDEATQKAIDILKNGNKRTPKQGEKTDVQPRTEESGRGGQQPRPDEQVGTGARNENERADGSGVAGRSGVHTVPDTERGASVPEPHKGAERLTHEEEKNTRNNHAERGVDYAPKGERARINANIAAIELAKKLLENGATATPEEMAVLRQYSGWGGLGAAFNEGDRWKPNPIFTKLKEILTPEEYEAAVMSRNSAYYTPAPVIDAMWDIAKALGFKGGNILEGSAGIGNIIGLMPRDISGRSDIHAVEIDAMTGGILSLLYPDAKVEVHGFEQTRVANNSVDLAITNVPFVTDLHVMDESGDSDLSKKFRDIHDFCIAKNVRKLREGGIGIFITTSGTLDKSKKLRDWLVSDKEGNVDVVGAFRLNNQTFGGTDATSDIIIVRKRVNGKRSANAIDVSTASIARTAAFKTDNGKTKDLPMMYNRYFIEHPEHMGGRMMFNFETGSTWREASVGLFPTADSDQTALMQEWVKSLAEKDWRTEAAASRPEPKEMHINEALGAGVKEGSMVLDSDGNLCVARMGRAVPLDINKNKIKGRTKSECFKDYGAVKSALDAVLKYQTEHDDDAGLQPLLDQLNRAYDTFVQRYGNLNKNVSLAWLRNNDIDYPSIAALETVTEKGGKDGKKEITYGKTDIFSRRVVDKESEPKPQNVKDGIIASIYKFGRIDTEYMAGQLGKSAEDIKKEIVESGLGFENPTNGQMEVSYEYLSGNVREKLRQAQEANEGGTYDANIKALEAVIPMNIPAHLIEFTLGSSWIDPKLYERYVKEKTGLDVTLRSVGGTWHMEEPWNTRNEKNTEMGVRSEKLNILIPGHRLINAAITNKQITVSKTVDKETITDPAATAMCAARVDEIRQEFKDWARGEMQNDPDMSIRMEQIYNDQFNNSVPVTIPDEFVPEHFGGAASTVNGRPFKLRPHQAKAVIRATTQPLMLAHEVGTGKTYTLITTAMEMRRLGTARKPMIVVQNATVGQFVASAKALYPNAKILTLEDADRNAEGRRAFYAKIKFNDLDMIVVPQSVFEKIPDSLDRQAQFIQDKIDEKMLVLEQMAEADPQGSSWIVKQAKNEIKRLENELSDLGSDEPETPKKGKKKDAKKEAVKRQNAAVKAKEMLDRETDDVEDFDSMGIDAILVDEAHEYKHLGFATAMQRGVKGVDSSYSKKSQGVFLKTQAVLEKTGGKNVVFATGTPISNTAAEIWTFMRYLMPADVMKEYGIYYFDDFVRNFGNLQQMLEFKTNGKYDEVNRFAGYTNLPELVRIWSTVADTVLTREAGGVKDKIPQMEGDKATDIFMPQTRALRAVMKYVKEELDAFDKMSGKEKKANSHIPLTMYGIAKAAAIDARLVQRDAEDDPNSKTNEAVRQTLQTLESTKSYNGTVAIFADNYQRKNKETDTVEFNLFEDIRKKLIANGVPAEQIVVMKPGMTVKKKLDIFDKVNAGEVRVIMGSTFTLGTGVNIQERLHTLIHLDAPNRPMDYTQRNGRILRQGNLHRDWNLPVRVLRFGVEDSLDVTAYQRLKTKGAIADSIMDGKKLMDNSMENRVLEEEQDLFGDITAQLSGSEYAMLKNQIEKEVRKLTAALKTWQADQTYIHNRKRQIEGQNRAAEKMIADNRTYLAKIEGAEAGDIRVGNLTFPNLEAMEDFFKEQNKKKKEQQDRVKDTYSSGAKMDITVNVGGFDFKIHTEITREMKRGEGSLFATAPAKMTYSCAELGLEDVPVHGQIIKNAMTDIMENVMTGKDCRERIEAQERVIERNKAEYASISKREGVPFEHTEALAAAEAKLAEYDELMKAEMAAKEAKYAEMDKDVEAASGVEYGGEEDEESESKEPEMEYNPEKSVNFASRYETEDGREIRYTTANEEGYGGLFDFDFSDEQSVSGDKRGGSAGGGDAVSGRTRASELQREVPEGRPGHNSGLDTKAGEFCKVERVFRETGSFNFTSGEKIESADDVAFIFSALEDAAKEHSFVVLVKDGRPTVVELGLGRFNATMVDLPTASLAYGRIKPEAVYFVHNHPSGNLVCSPEDVKMLRQFEKIADINVPVYGVVINLKTGKYGTFDADNNIGTGHKRTPANEHPLTVHTLDKQIFASDYDPMAQPLIRSSQDVASLLNSQRMGDRGKVSFLILSQANRVVGNIHTQWATIPNKVEDIARFINDKVIQFGGKSAILYGDFEIESGKRTLYHILKARMSEMGDTGLLDIMSIQGNHTRSAADEGIIYEPGSEYGAVVEMPGEKESNEAVADKIERLFDAAVSGDLKGKPVEVGRLTKEGKVYLEKISGMKLKENTRFVLNPSDLKHIYNDHYSTNEKDQGNNIPLNKEDIRSINEILSNPDRVVYGVESEGDKRKMFFFLKESDNGCYNLVEVYANTWGNLTSKSFYKTKKSASQRVLSLKKSEHLTSVTDGPALNDGAKLPKFFDNPTIGGKKEFDIRFREVEDEQVLQEFAEGKTVKVYRTMQVIEGKLYSPMATKVGGKETPEIKLGVPEQAEEHPEIIKKTKIGKDGVEYGIVSIDKGLGKGSLEVAYNSYIHASRTPINDQFTSARIRPNLVTVESLVPEGELTSGYRAPMAKNAVGEMSWHSGTVSGQLSALGKPRRVILSRYDMPVRIVPNKEVARMIAEQLDGTEIEIPYNVVTPQVRAELERLGVTISETASGTVNDEADYGKAEYITDQEIERINAKQMEMAQTSEEAKRGHAERLSKKFGAAIRVVTDVTEITHSDPKMQERMRRSAGWYDTRSGEVVLVLPNNRSVEEVAKTVLHEVVAHKGLREMIGEENYDAFCDEVYDHLKEDLKQEAEREATRNFEAEPEKGYDHAKRKAVDEMFGRMAEKGFEDFTREERGIWAKLKSKVLEAINKFLGALKLPKWVKLGDNELRYMLWKSHERMATSDKPATLVERAMDIAKRNELGLTSEVRFRDEETGDIWKDRSVGLEERITNAAIRLSNNQSGDLTLRNDAMRAIGGNLTSLRRAMAAQRAFDQSTVKRVADLARILMQNGYMDGMTSGEVKRLISAVKNSVGHKEVKESVQKVMDIMVQNQLRNGEAILRQLLAIKGSKVNSKGQKVQGELDATGQTMVKAFKDAISVPITADENGLPVLTYIDGEIEDALKRMESDVDMIADTAAAEYAGLMLAKEYAETIGARKLAEKNHRKALAEAEDKKRAGEMDANAYRQFVDAIEDEIRSNKIEMAQAYFDLVAKLSDSLRESIENARAFKEAEKERIAKIRHLANADMEGRPLKGHRDATKMQKILNNKYVRWPFETLSTFDQMLKMFGSHNSNGQGYLHDYFMRSWIDAADKEQTLKEKYHKQMDDKAAEIFGERKVWWNGGMKSVAYGYKDLYEYADAMKSAYVTYHDGAEMREFELSQGVLLSLYAVDKMPLGRATNRNMGITDEVMEQITDVLDPKLKAYADWVQEEFLPGTRIDIDEEYVKVQGAHLDAIENYFPFLRDKHALKREVQNGQQSQPNDRVGVMGAGLFKKRVNSVSTWDIPNYNFFDVLARHIEDAAHDTAYAEFNRDLGTLLSYNRFQQQVMAMSSVYGRGEKLLQRFKEVCAIAADCYEPKRSAFDAITVQAAKGITMGKIAFRTFTAAKQVLSMPAFFGEVSPKYIAKDLAMLGIPALQWSWKNMPNFRKRILERTAGDYRLRENEYDNRIMKAVWAPGKIGMLPNIAVDGWTIAIGAHGHYQTMKAKYLRWGMEEAAAEKRAIQDAELCFNKSQQSSEGAFMAPIQVDHTLWSTVTMLFRNSSTSYSREAHNAARNLKRIMSGEVNVDFMAKQWLRMMEVKTFGQRFDEELAQQVAGTLPVGHIYQLGKPGGILQSAGFPDMPIELSSTRLAEKANQGNHVFPIGAVKGLVEALNKPLAVFRYGNNAMNVIVGLNYQGKQFLVGVHFNQQHDGIEVSSVRGLFPKDNAEWLNWITQGKATYLDHKKIQALIDKQRINLADVDYLDLDDVAKVMENFDNPAIPTQKSNNEWSEEDWSKARKYAKEEIRHDIVRNGVNLAMFGWILPWLWRIGGIAPLLLLSSDNDEKQKQIADATKNSVFAPMEGLAYGDVMNDLLTKGTGLVDKRWRDIGRGNPLFDDLKQTLMDLDKDFVVGCNDVFNIIGGMTTGVNPQTVTDWVAAIMDASNDNETRHETAILVARLMNCPQSQIDKLYFEEIGLSGEEASKLTPKQLAERYAQYKVKRGTMVTPWVWNDEERFKGIEENAMKRIKASIDKSNSAEINEAYAQLEERYKAVQALKTKCDKAKKRDDTEYAQAATELNQHPDLQLYLQFKGLNKNLNLISKMWLESRTAEEASLTAETIPAYRAAMVKALSAETAEAQQAALQELGNLWTDFSGKIQAIRPPAQRPNR